MTQILGHWVTPVMAKPPRQYWETHMVRSCFASEPDRRRSLANARLYAERAGFVGRMSFHYRDIMGRVGYLIEVRIEAGE